MDPHQLLATLAGRLWATAAALADDLADPLSGLQQAAGITDPALQGRLLEALSPPPPGNALLTLVREIVGDLPDGSPLRWHGWERAPGARRGLALVLTGAGGRAVLALSPGPVVDLVVTAGAVLTHASTVGPWQLSCQLSTGPAWQATWRPGQAAAAAAGTATVALNRTQATSLGDPGPGVSWSGLVARLTVSPGAAARVQLDLLDFSARVLPAALQSLLGGASGAGSRPAPLSLAGDRAGGLRFAGGGVRVPLAGPLQLPGLEVRSLAVELDVQDGRPLLRPTLSAVAGLPALPVSLTLERVAVGVPLTIDADRLGLGSPDAPLPGGLGVELDLPPVSGGGLVRRDPATGQYGGVLDLDLGVVQVQALGLLRLPGPEGPLSFLLLLSAAFPPPGIQLSFGFALGAVGGLVGVNRRVETDRLRALVSDGDADRVMFPENAVARAEEILASLGACFPAAGGRHVVGPMLQITWGGRLVTLSVAVLLELPAPVRVLLLGRLLIGIPDPAVPVVRLQASVYGRVDPGVPLAELLVSLTGSWVGGVPVSGELYLLFRGGSQPAFVLSAGGFHPRFVRPPGVPALRRVSMDLGGGFLGLRGEAYLALTSNSLQLGAAIHLDATIAGCGVEGHLGLDALFVWEPVLAFSVQVQAGVAVLAFGRRLASVALRFTLEGPGAWHAYGSGSISVLFWDVDLDFDVRWGTPAELTAPPPDIVATVRDACARRDAWTIARGGRQVLPVLLTPAAEQDLAAGDVALPDARLRLSQRAVPLDLPITRFHRLAVPEQTWVLGAVHLGGGDPAALGPRVVEDFVPGEFLTLTEDEQLTRPAFEPHRSGAEIGETAGVRAGARRRAEDSYETDYQVEEGWFPAEPPDRTRIPGLGNLTLEWFARPIPPTARVAVWQSLQERAFGAAPRVVLR